MPRATDLNIRRALIMREIILKGEIDIKLLMNEFQVTKRVIYNDLKFICDNFKIGAMFGSNIIKSFMSEDEENKILDFVDLYEDIFKEV